MYLAEEMLDKRNLPAGWTSNYDAEFHRIFYHDSASPCALRTTRTCQTLHLSSGTRCLLEHQPGGL